MNYSHFERKKNKLASEFRGSEISLRFLTFFFHSFDDSSFKITVGILWFYFSMFLPDRNDVIIDR